MSPFLIGGGDSFFARQSAALFYPVEYLILKEEKTLALAMRCQKTLRDPTPDR